MIHSGVKTVFVHAVLSNSRFILNVCIIMLHRKIQAGESSRLVYCFNVYCTYSM